MLHLPPLQQKLIGMVTVVKAYPDVFHTGIYGQIKPNGGRHTRLAITGCTNFGFQNEVQTMLVGCGGIQAILRPGYFLYKRLFVVYLMMYKMFWIISVKQKVSQFTVVLQNS